MILLDTVTTATGVWADNRWTQSLNQSTPGLAVISVDGTVSRSGRGSGAIRFDLTGDGTVNTYRAELSGEGAAGVVSGINRGITAGMERWYAASYMAGPETNVDYANGEVIFQIHGTSSAWGFASPAFLIYAHMGKFCIAHRYDSVLDSPDAAVIVKPFEGPVGSARIVKGQWYDIVVRHVVSHTGPGTIQAWIDGTLVYSNTSLPNSYNQTGFTHYFKFGIYSWRWRTVPPTQGSVDARRVWYVDDVRVGDAASVLGDFTLSAAPRVLSPFTGI